MQLTPDLDRRLHRLQRATVARSALDVIAIIFLCAGFAFWGVAFWQLLGPPAILSLLSIQAVVLALVFSLAAPLLLSMLVPTTPAGQLLQKTQWRTIGFPVIIACAVFLTYHAEHLIELWLYAQPAIREAGFARPLAISLTIAFVVIPALAWVQLSPDRWLAAIQQAHAVKKLELQQRGELAIIKASLLRAERLALIGWANLLPMEQQEVYGTMRALIQSTSDIQRDIVRTIDLGADLERSIMDDEAISAELAYVARALDVLPDIAPPRDTPTDVSALDLSRDAFEREKAQGSWPPQQDAAPASPQPRPASAGRPAPPRPAAPRRAPPLYAAEYEKALVSDDLATGMWSPGQLGMVFGKSERTARTWISVWESAGLVSRADTKGLFYFTEWEAA